MEPEHDSQDTAWRLREAERFSTLEYRYTPWENMPFWRTDQALRVRRYHYAHIANKDNAMLSFTPNNEFGREDRQLVMRPGKYLRKYFPWMGPQEIEAAVARWKGAELFKLQIATTPDEIERVYVEGPRSCMGGYNFSSLPRHPAAVYGAGDLGVAYFMDSSLDEGQQVAARTIVHLHNKVYASSIYGDYQTLGSLLREDGWTQATYNQWRGAKLLKIETGDVYDEGEYLMPYLDIAEEVSEFPFYFRIGSGFKKAINIVGCHSTGGTVYHLTTCYSCGDGIPEGSVYHGHGENYCSHCFDETFTYCGGCGDYDLIENVSWFTCVDLWLCEGCVDDHVFECENCGESYPHDERYDPLPEFCMTCGEELDEDTKDEEEEEKIIIKPVTETHTGDLFEYVLRWSEEETTDV